MLADADTQFSTMPKGMMDYVLFMNKAKTIKTKPAKWSDMFVPAFQSRKGSKPKEGLVEAIYEQMLRTVTSP